MKKPMTDISHGKKFEADLKSEVFEGLGNQLPIYFERVMDSHEAGNIVRKADADFKLTITTAVKGRPFHFWIECKASIVHDTFATCFRISDFLKPDQVARMRIGERAGAKAVYLFRNVKENRVEVWNGKTIHEEYMNKRQKFFGEPAYELHFKNMRAWALSICTDPQTFLDTLNRY